MFEKGSQRITRRQSTAVIASSLLLALLLGSCAQKPDESLRGTVGFVQGFLGGVVADEPRAALAGREILSVGGSAADAAVATYFALAVTLPSVATLGGGGICLVHDPAKEKTQMLDFIAPAPTSASGAGRPVATPMNARGLFVLHARHGRLKWAQLVAPAANMARFGVPVSRAFARDLAKAIAVIGADAEARRVFGRPDGTGPLREGDRLVQVDLAGLLERIRNQGPGYIHGGEGAVTLVQAYRGAGFALDRDDLRGAVPVWRDTVVIPIEGMGRRVLAYFTVAPAIGGDVAGRIVNQLAEKDRYARAGATERAPMFIDAATRALSETAQDLALADGSAATAFVAADRDGMVVACAVTAHQLFGVGKIPLSTGILPAAVPTAGARGPSALAAMIVDDRVNDGAVFAAAATGGAAAATAMAQVAARTLFEGYFLEEALAGARLHPIGRDGAVHHESHLDDATIQALAGRGVKLGGTYALGSVNALACPGGLLKLPQSCSLRADPRALGLAAEAD